MTGLEFTLLMAGFAAAAAIVVLVRQAISPVRDMRLMRCPETGSVASVCTERVSCGTGEESEVQVRSCDLWPGKRGCTRGCLARYEQTAPGYLINVESLKPFERP